MNDTPTPRERFRKTLDISTGVSELLADSNTSYISWLETELAAVTEQRDRLAEALKQIQGVGLVAVDAFDELDRIDEIVDEALQSLNQTTEP